MNKQRAGYSKEYQMLKELDSIGEFTNGEYPTFDEFVEARSESRVSGRFNERVVIVSNNPRKAYTFSRYQ